MRTFASLVLLTLPTLASAAPPVLDIGGSCPGMLNIDITEATAEGSVWVLVGPGEGSWALPGGPCAGVATGLSDVSHVFGAGADGAGSLSFSPSAPAGVCSRYFQVLDLATCTLSDAVPATGAPVDAGGCPGLNAVANPGFEDGLTDWNLSGFGEEWTDRDVAAGSYSMDLTSGGSYVESFPSLTPVSSLSSASWQWKSEDSGAISSVQWDYSDGSSDSYLFFSDGFAPAGEWVTADILPFLDPSKSVSRLRVYGFSGGDATPDSILIDDFRFCY